MVQARLSSPERILLLSSVEVLGFIFVWFEWRLLLLVFGGFLFAILLNTVSNWIREHTGLKAGVCFVVTVALLAAVLACVGLLLVPRVVTQLSELSTTFPHSVDHARSYLQERAWGKALLQLLHSSMQAGALRSKLATLGQSISDGAVDFVVIAVIGFFGALSPSVYRKGLLRLFPISYQRQVERFNTHVIATLRWWLLGQMVPMAVLGVLSMIVLWAFGLPLAFTLGVLTGLMAFIPYVGSVLSGIPAVLFAFDRSAETALYVLILYTVLHVLEGYLLTPFVQKRAIRIPPVVTVLSQFFFWTFGGVLGVSVATPIAAVGLLVIREFYVQERHGGPEDATAAETPSI